MVDTLLWNLCFEYNRDKDAVCLSSKNCSSKKWQGKIDEIPLIIRANFLETAVLYTEKIISDKLHYITGSLGGFGTLLHQAK